MVFGYDLLCDVLEMLNFNKYRSAVATRRNLVDPVQSKNKRPDGLMVRAFDLRTEMDTFFHFIFSIYFLFMCAIYFRRIFQY
jgi:hypothetical protein